MDDPVNRMRPVHDALLTDCFSYSRGGLGARDYRQQGYHRSYSSPGTFQYQGGGGFAVGYGGYGGGYGGGFAAVPRGGYRQSGGGSRHNSGSSWWD